MKQNNRAVGTAYERIAGQYLEKKGYGILTYNYRCKSGEIDIIAMDGDTLVFCEVKYRLNSAAGHPFEAVDIKKQKAISKSALYYITLNNLSNLQCRFDVIGILGEEVLHLENAFGYNYY